MAATSTPSSLAASPSSAVAGKRTSTPQSVPGSISIGQPKSLHSTSVEPVENHPNIYGLTGRSPVMSQLIAQMHRMAPHLTLATLEGEEGTGRTLSAHALHAAGPASEGPFVSCLATRFFSVEASRESDRHGAWDASILHQSHGGMICLDRVHQLSGRQQEALAEFLHWFDDRHFHARQEATGMNAGGGHLPLQVVFSSSIPLRHPGSGFREDLASRLCAVRFRLPPLTERREDIPLLAQIFIQRFARAYGKPVRGLGPGSITPLLRYAWPGNVRQLEEAITAAALETESQWIRPIDLPPLPAANRHSLGNLPAGMAETGPERDCDLDSVIRSHVIRVLRQTRGNKLRAAQLLGISRSTLYRILAAREGALAGVDAAKALIK